jgi:hypothetical protein
MSQFAINLASEMQLPTITFSAAIVDNFVWLQAVKMAQHIQSSGFP